MTISYIVAIRMNIIRITYIQMQKKETRKYMCLYIYIYIYIYVCVCLYMYI